MHLTKKEEANKLREEVKKELVETKGNLLKQLNFIDALERLGVSYHFEQEIQDALQQIYDSFQSQCANYDLHHISTLFRILRQHGFHVSSGKLHSPLHKILSKLEYIREKIYS